MPPPGPRPVVPRWGPAAPRHFDSIYYDTPDPASFSDRGSRSRRRTEGDRSAWQLEVPSAEARLEVEVLAKAGRRPFPRRPSGCSWASPGGGRSRKWRGSGRGARRLGCDAGSCTSRTWSSMPSRFSPVRKLSAASTSSRSSWWTATRTTSNSSTGARGQPERRTRPGPSKLCGRSASPSRRHRQRLPRPPSPFSPPPLRAQAERLLALDVGTRLGLDPEDLHQFRVATRRLRAFLRAGRELVEREWADALRTELGWARRAARGVRDRDVLIDRLRGETVQFHDGDRAAAEPLFAELEREREAARSELLAGLESDRYLELLGRVGLEDPPLTGAEPSLRSVWSASSAAPRRRWRRSGALPPTRSCTPPGSGSSAPAMRPSSRRPSWASGRRASLTRRRICRTSSATTRTRSSPSRCSASLPAAPGRRRPARPADRARASASRRRALRLAARLETAGEAGQGTRRVTLVLVRHAWAGKRSHWRGDDRLRPLDDRGRRQAAELLEVLGGVEIGRIVSSPDLRCVQTVEPLAAERGLEVEPADALGEDLQGRPGSSCSASWSQAPRWRACTEASMVRSASRCAFPRALSGSSATSSPTRACSLRRPVGGRAAGRRRPLASRRGRARAARRSGGARRAGWSRRRPAWPRAPCRRAARRRATSPVGRP